MAIRIYDNTMTLEIDAITALALAERLAAGYGDDDRFVIGLRKELFL